MAYVLRRLLEMIPVLLIVVAATFFLAHAVPGGPFDKDRPLPAEVKARLEQYYGLDQPLHVEAIFATDERRLPGQSEIVARDRIPNKCSECLWPIRVSPAKIIEDGDAIGSGTHSDRIPYSFIDSAGRHVVRIEIAKARVHPTGEDQSAIRG